MYTSIYFFIFFKIKANWEGSFMTSSFFPSFKSKYMLMPDPAYLDPVFEANFPDEAASSRLKAKDYEEAKVSKSLVTQAC